MRGEAVDVDLNPGALDDLRALLGDGDADEETLSLRRETLHRDSYADLAVFRVDSDALND